MGTIQGVSRKLGCIVGWCARLWAPLMALELDAVNRIFTTLPVVPVLP